MMRFADVCAGISASTTAWEPLGWECAVHSEIEAFPRAVLEHRWPGVPLHGDFMTIKGSEYGAIDVLVGGTPCQDFSVAGLRKGLDGDRGNLTLEFLRLAARMQPTWVVWENVPGALSIDGGRAFGAILGGLAQCGYGFAYRILDAQYFGVPQRRRRVFVVGYLGDWRPAAAVLFERAGLQGDITPRRTAREGADAGVAPSIGASGRGFARAGESRGQDCLIPEISGTVPSKWAKGTGGPAGNECQNLVAHALRGEGFDASEDGTGCGTPLVPVAFDGRASGRNGFAVGEMAPTLRAMGHVAVAFDLRGRDGGAFTMEARTRAQSVVAGYAVRHLTPLECERLQGFPDGYTRIPWRSKPREMCPDGPRYKALGNSMAVPVMRWLGERIELVRALIAEREAA